jgi:hypothetical protein
MGHFALGRLLRYFIQPLLRNTLYIERVAEFIGGHFVLHSSLLPLYLSSMLALFRLLLPSFSGSVPPNPASIC